MVHCSFCSSNSKRFKQLHLNFTSAYDNVVHFNMFAICLLIATYKTSPNFAVLFCIVSELSIAASVMADCALFSVL